MVYPRVSTPPAATTVPSTCELAHDGNHIVSGHPPVPRYPDVREPRAHPCSGTHNTRALTTHDTDTTRDQSPYKQPVTVFWIHVNKHPLLQHEILTGLRPMIRKGKGTVHPTPEAWSVHESKEAIYQRFWNTWNTTTNQLRDRGSWSNTQFADVYDTRAKALRWAPQPWLRKISNLRPYRRVHSNRVGRWIYAIYSIKTQSVHIRNST